MDEAKCQQIGKLQGERWERMHDLCRRVYSPSGLSPTIPTMGGGHQDPKIIVPEATKKGYAEAGIGDSINMAFPSSKTRRGRVGHGVAQTLTTNDAQQVVVEPVAYDEQNGYLRKDDCVGTLTTDGSSPKHNNRIVEPLSEHRFYQQAIETLCENDCEEGDTIDAYNKRVNKDGVSPTITTRPDGFKTAILPVIRNGGKYELSDAMKRYINSQDGKYCVNQSSLTVNRDIACAKTTREGSTRADASDYITNDLPDNASVAGVDLLPYRIRKLTPRECFRLMGVAGEDFEKVRYGAALPKGSNAKIADRTMTKDEWRVCWRIMRHDRQSVSSCYHLAGDSIVTTCLMAIFGELLSVDYNAKINELTEGIRDAD